MKFIFDNEEEFKNMILNCDACPGHFGFHNADGEYCFQDRCEECWKNSGAEIVIGTTQVKKDN